VAGEQECHDNSGQGQCEIFKFGHGLSLSVLPFPHC
jgi:hypothetical protein